MLWVCGRLFHSGHSNPTEEPKEHKDAHGLEALPGPSMVGGIPAGSLYVAHWTPLSMGFAREEYWSELLCPSPDLPDPGIKPMTPTLAGRFFTTELPGSP